MFKMMEDGETVCKLLPTSPHEPDDRHYISQYYSTGTEQREETVETSEDRQVECGAEQTSDDGRTDGRFFVIKNDWYSDDREEGEINEDYLDLEEEEESKDDSLDLEQERLDCELEDEVLYTEDGWEDNPIIID